MPADPELLAAARAALTASRLAALNEELAHFTATAAAAKVPGEIAEAKARVEIATKLIAALQS